MNQTLKYSLARATPHKEILVFQQHRLQLMQGGNPEKAFRERLKVEVGRRINR